MALLPHIDEPEALAAPSDLEAQLPPERRAMVSLVRAFNPRLGAEAAAKALDAASRDIAAYEAANPDEPLRALLVASPHLGGEERAALLADALPTSEAESGDSTRSQVTVLLGLVATRLPAPFHDRARRETLACLKTGETEPADEFTPFALLSPLLSAGEWREPLDRLLYGAPPGAADDRIGELRFALLPYLTGKDFETLAWALLDTLPGLPRIAALALLAGVEGPWGEILDIHPALANGAPPRGFIERMGGPGAVAEVARSIGKVAAWWP